MDDLEMQALISAVIHCERLVNDLSADEFAGLMDGLSRMYNARIWNCVDATGKWDAEWRALSDVFARARKEIAKEGN